MHLAARTCVLCSLHALYRYCILWSLLMQCSCISNLPGGSCSYNGIEPYTWYLLKWDHKSMESCLNLLMLKINNLALNLHREIKPCIYRFPMKCTWSVWNNLICLQGFLPYVVLKKEKRLYKLGMIGSIKVSIWCKLSEHINLLSKNNLYATSWTLPNSSPESWHHF